MVTIQDESIKRFGLSLVSVSAFELVRKMPLSPLSYCEVLAIS